MSTEPLEVKSLVVDPKGVSEASADSPWVVLVVDDDEDMRLVTEMVLGDLVFDGRPLELLFAGSYQEAKDLVDARGDIALALVDVVMETEDAGLRLVRHIREISANPYTRIVLRTGQPGHAPEGSVTRDYDINDYREKTELDSRKLGALVYTALRGYRDIMELRRLRDRFDALAHLDGLTGIANRRRFDETLALEWRRCQRSKLPLGIVMCDVDLFKRYNDQYGHQSGDEVLRLVGRVLDKVIHRPADMVARYGGEEFACILPDTSEAGAVHIAEEMRLAVANLEVPCPECDTRPRVTMSFGVAVMAPCKGCDSHQLAKLADARLYLAKEAGRNCVVASSDESDAPVSAEASSCATPLALARQARAIAGTLDPDRPDLKARLEQLIAALSGSGRE